ncbi:MAG: o-succinylbenzoate synthase, partial [Acidimicrobiia bacterium]
MRLSEIELRRVRLPLVAPFRTALETKTHREVLLVRVRGPEAGGWGECAAFTTPHYSSETLAGAHEALRDTLIPLIEPDHVSVEEIADVLAPVTEHPMARAAL